MVLPKIARNAMVDAADQYGVAPLTIAAAKGQIELVQLLLDHGATVDVDKQRGDTPLRKAAEYGHTKVVQLLLDHGATADVADEDGWTPLRMAVRYAHLEVVQLLLEHGATVDVVDKRGTTPLWIAVEFGFTQVVQVLLEHKAKVDAAKSHQANLVSDTAVDGACNHPESMIETNIPLMERIGPAITDSKNISACLDPGLMEMWHCLNHPQTPDSLDGLSRALYAHQQNEELACQESYALWEKDAATPAGEEDHTIWPLPSLEVYCACIDTHLAGDHTTTD